MCSSAKPTATRRGKGYPAATATREVRTCRDADATSCATQSASSHLIIPDAGATVERKLLDDAVEDVREWKV